MPNSSRPTTRRGFEEKVKMGKLGERSSSFNGRFPATQTQTLLRRPKTDPDLLSGTKLRGFSPENSPRLTKLLLNVTVHRSLGAIHVIMSPESTVGDLIIAVLRQYVKEGRRPSLPTLDSSGFNLHYSQFSLESLDREAKLITLGSRNFFLYPCNAVASHAGANVAASSCSKEISHAGANDAASSCSNEIGKASKVALPWWKFISFLF